VLRFDHTRIDCSLALHAEILDGQGELAVAETKAAKMPAKKPREAAASQREMLMPIAGNKPVPQAAAKQPAAGQRRKSA
jgi:hypothetical protein